MKLSTRGAAKASEFFRRNMTAVTAAVMLLSLMGYLIVDSAVFSTGCYELYDGVLRLHILANSDTRQDQQLKLRVRDRILLEAEQMGLGEGFTIGEGRGHNWWCVLFPQMCLPPAFAQPEQPPQFSSAQLRVLSARPQYEPRFALLELLHRQEALS